MIEIKEDYATSARVPTADQISLKSVLEYYENYLEPYIHTYTHKNEHGKWEKIVLKFDFPHFPHLIGLHYAANAKYGRTSKKAKEFRGYVAYQNIKSGKIDKQTIKSITPKKTPHYKNMTRKMRYFFNVHNVLENPEAVYFNKEKNGKKGSLLNCDILLYKFINDRYIHIGIDKEDSRYIAKTFLIESTPVFVDGQKNIAIEKSEKVKHRKEET